MLDRAEMLLKVAKLLVKPFAAVFRAAREARRNNVEYAKQQERERQARNHTKTADEILAKLEAERKRREKEAKK